MKTPSDRPVFLLGVGAQKAGTTWLYDYLAQHPQAALPVEKQMDYFSVLFQPQVYWGIISFKMRKLRALIDQQLQPTEIETTEGSFLDRPDDLAAVIDSVLCQFDPPRYMQLYRELLRNHPQARLTADITPEYGCLDVGHYRAIRQMLIDEGYSPRVVFLLRDPVERCFSLLRMNDAMGFAEGRELKAPPAHVRFRWAATRPEPESFTRYDRTITSLEQAFSPEELFFGIYEDFFRKSEISRLCGFLGLSYRAPNLGKRVNASQRPQGLTQSDMAFVRAYYQDVYDFCRTRFGHDRIDALWTAGAPAAPPPDERDADAS